jgi:transmembrane sensor
MDQANKTAAGIEQQAAQWLARQDGARWSAGAQAELDAWLDADVQHRVAYLRLRAAWRRADALDGAARPDPLPGPVSARRPAPAPAVAWRLAAGLLLACGLGAVLAPEFGWRQGERYATRTGENRTVALADGSRLTLNTATRLRAAPDGQRKVWLDSGEAYFDIAPDPAHPFVVDAGASRVTVLGTRFTVRRDGERTSVLVEQGRVRVSTNGAALQAADAVELTRNQEASAVRGRIARAERSPAQTAQRMAWRSGRIVFDGATLGEAVAEFNRYNERKLVLADQEAAALPIGGSFAPSNLNGFVRLLEQGFGLQAQRGDAQIVLSRAASEN